MVNGLDLYPGENTIIYTKNQPKELKTICQQTGSNKNISIRYKDCNAGEKPKYKNCDPDRQPPRRRPDCKDRDREILRYDYSNKKIYSFKEGGFK